MNRDEQTQREASELLNRYHQRASIHDGDKLIIEPGQVLDNIALAMERVDNDIDTSVSIEEDVAASDEIQAMIESMHLGPTLAIHVVNTAMRIMSARYPAELVDRPLPPEYDLRRLLSLTINDQEHEAAKTIFNQRTASSTDLTEADVASTLDHLDVGGKMTVFVALFYMYGTKISAMKNRTGIQ